MTEHTINLDKVIHRFEDEENIEDKPTSYFLGPEITTQTMKDEGLGQDLIDDLKDLGADTSWWFGSKQKNPHGILELGGDPPLISKKEALEGLGFNYEKFMRQVNSKLQDNWKIVTDELGFNLSMTDPSELAEELSDGSVKSIIKILMELEESDPQDLPVWVAETLKDHGKQEVTLREWVYADAMFTRLLKAETASFANDLLERAGVKDLFDSIFGKFLGGL